MLKAEKIEVSGLANALYGMRLPKRSHAKSDSNCLVYDFEDNDIRNITLNNVMSSTKVIKVNIGDNDRKLANNLVIAGTDHGKWLRQVQISMLITAPMTFWWDFDTYKVSTVKNSSSRMHKITSRELNENDFSWDNEDGELVLTPFRESQLEHLNEYIVQYNDKSLPEEEKKRLFRLIIQDLPDSYNFTALWTGSGQTARNYRFARKDHKQKELRDLAVIFSELDEIGGFITTTKLIKEEIVEPVISKEMMEDCMRTAEKYPFRK